MIKNLKDKRICEKYSTRDDTSHVHCGECPLVIDKYLYMCKANSSYNRHIKEWEFDKQY